MSTSLREATLADLPTLAAYIVALEDRVSVLEALLNLVVGTTLIVSPPNQNTTYSSAHGMGATPHLVLASLKCLTANLNYSVNDVVFIQTFAFVESGAGGNEYGVGISASATMLYAIVSNNGISVPDKTTQTLTAITAGSWSLRLTPYRVQ
jgi:hypothetical protein